MAYTLVNGNTVYPSQVSYQLITLTADIILSWPSSFLTGAVAAGFNDTNPNQNGWMITLPDATLSANGTDVIFNNISVYSFNIHANDGTFLYTITSGQIIDFKLYNSSTPAGLWRIIPFGGGYNGIVSFLIQSSDNSITVINGDISPPGDIIDLTLPTSLTNLTNVEFTGLPVITSVDPLTWKTTEIISGNNITVNDGDGILGDPVINLNNDIRALTSLEVGAFNFNGLTLSAVNVNDNLNFLTDGTGVLNFNGVTVDENGTTTINNLIVSGGFSNPFTPKAWCIFTDISSTIVIEDNANVTSVTPVTGSSGSYEIFFSTPMANINYGVLISLGTTGDTLPFVSHGFWTTRNTNSVIISIVDASGQLVLSVPNGITVMIMSA